MTQKQKHDDLVTILLTQSVAGLHYHNWVFSNNYVRYKSNGKWELSDKGQKKLMGYDRFRKTLKG